MCNNILSSLKTRLASSHSIFRRPLSQLPLTELSNHLQVVHYFFSLNYTNNRDNCYPSFSDTDRPVDSCWNSITTTQECQSLCIPINGWSSTSIEARQGDCKDSISHGNCIKCLILVPMCRPRCMPMWQKYESTTAKASVTDGPENHLKCKLVQLIEKW